ncbi:hypothetical protein I4U23_012181 [Adineta vaga]|nr:hypothetical protein I4U23_012181 [Adineta vaga]
MRQSRENNQTCNLSAYDYELLLNGTYLMHTEGDLTLETLFDELLKFKDIFNDNERNLYYNTCVLKTLVDFMKIMASIQYVFVNVHYGDIGKLLDMIEWKGLLQMRRTLKKVTLQGTNSVIEETQLTQKALQIQQQLVTDGRTIKFKVKLK